MRAVEYAIQLAEETDGRLTLFHAIELPPELHEFLPIDTDVSSMRSAAEAAARTRLETLVPDGARTYCTIDTRVAEGKAHRQILAVAAEIGADLIMVGTHDHTAFERFLLGSTATRVVREAGCPVIVVRAKTYRAVPLVEVVPDDHPHKIYVPPHRYHYHDDRVITRPPDWPLY